MNEGFLKEKKDIQSLSSQELHEIFYTKDGLRSFLQQEDIKLMLNLSSEVISPTWKIFKKFWKL